MYTSFVTVFPKIMTILRNSIKKKESIVAFLYFIFSYLLIYSMAFNINNVPYVGKDMFRVHLPAREYLYDSLNSGKFPFWIEYKLSGYPSYADLENLYLNPLNVILVYLFGPYTSLKLLIFITYLMGSFGMYKLLQKYGSTLLGFICSHTIYFFSLYSFFHTQHLGIILTIYLLPLGLFLFSNFNKGLKNTVLLSLLDVYIFSFGSFQLLFISFIARAIYYLCFMYSRVNIISDIKKFTSYILITTILSFPVLLPSIELYSYSNGLSRVNPLEGSLTPINLLTGFVPFIYGKEGYFNGYIFCKDCVIQEVYFYFGISSLFLFIASVLYQTDNRVSRFCLYLIAVGLFLSVFGEIPILNNYPIFPLNLFRYWSRALILLILAISFGVNQFISSKEIGKFKLNNLIPYFIITSALFLLQVSITSLAYVKDFWFYISHYTFDNQGSHMKLWLIISFLSLVFTLIILIAKQKTLLFKSIIVFLVFIDLGSFITLSIWQKGFVDVNALPSRHECISNLADVQNNSRVLDLSGCLNTQNTHSTDLWSILGRTQYTNTSYKESLESIGIVRDREISLNSGITLMQTLDYESIKKLGVSLIFAPGGKVIDLNNPIIPNNTIKNIKPLPGEVMATVKDDLTKTERVNTYITFYPGWKVYVDKNPINLDTTYNGFISFVVNPGDSDILIKFWPEAFFRGVILTTILLPLTFFIMYKLNKYRTLSGDSHKKRRSTTFNLS